MDGTSLAAGIGIGAAAGALAAWVLAQSRARRATEEAAARFAELAARAAGLEQQVEAERRRLEDRVRDFQAMEARFREAFTALSADALRANTEEFLKLAGTKFSGMQESARGDLEAKQKAIDALLDPVRKGLDKVESVLQGVERERAGAYGALLEQVKTLSQSQGELRAETANLVTALRAPQVRGRWGEIQLRRVVEMAGMLDHCDFTEQASTSVEGGRLRPDLVVHLPGGKNVVVDAKTPLDAYLRAVEAKDDAGRDAALTEHARQVRDHVRALSQKSYWEQFDPSPEFVVMFLPGETFFSAALQKDPGLVEFGVEQRVIPASPTTLIALLRSVAYGWQQERVAENAQRIHDLGRELHSRLRIFAEHLADVGDGLKGAVGSYNKALASMESRLLVTARELERLGAARAGESLREISPVDQTPRALEGGDVLR